MKRITLKLLVVAAALLGALAIVPTVRAASVGPSGYTNSFDSQPAAADWATFSIAGGAGDITAASGLDSAVQAVSASSITAQVQADPADPPPILGSASWSAAGMYLQTRATGNGATLLMCTLVNDLGGNAIGATISYDYAKVAVAAEEVEGHRAYYSLSGEPGSWIAVPTFSSANPGRLTANIDVAWPGGGNLYVLWADDNGSPSPDAGNQIDNFSATATPGAHVPVAITAQPQSQTVGELEPVTFTVGLSGNPPPSVQWYTNDVPIPGATSVTYSIASTPLNFGGLNFKAIAQNVASNVTYSATSAVAVLTVNADNVRPVLLGAVASGSIQVVATFSERLAAQTAANTANYSVTGSTGSLIVSNAFLDASQTNVVLTVTTMTPGATYTLTVNGLTDQAAAANQIAANSQAQFTAATYTPSDIGGPGGTGSAIGVGNGFAVTGGGTNILGTADQFFFHWRQIAGDFDLKVRLDGLAGSDAWAKAGLMARETLTANSKHASTFATPNVSGTFFSYRPGNGSNTVNTGSFPAAYPSTWLRLRRAGATFTGYAGVDGQNWTQLGTGTLVTPANIFYVGMAVTGSAPSNAPATTATAQFRDFGDGSGGVVGDVALPFEPPGPSSRNTGLIISEIMYHPKPGNNLEFIEVFNAGLIAENLAGYRIAGDVDYTFPANTVLPVGSFLVVARNPADVQAAHGISGVLGPWDGASTNALPDDEGTVRLRNRSGAMMLEVNYEARAPWPLAADGAGHSLVLARPSYGENEPRAWANSDRIGGSPGRVDPYGLDPLRNVVINEFLAHTDPPLEDFIELYNHGNQDVDLSGAYLSDDRDTNKFRIPNGTIIPARGFVSFVISTATTGFALSSGGERIYFVNPSQTRVIDMVAFEAQANGISSGRYPDGAPGFHELASRTPGDVNAPLLIRDVVINELMFNPISGSDDDEYVELYNRGASAVDLSLWRFTAGINFQFPANVSIPANGFLVIARNQANLLAKYPQLNAGNTLGNYDGALANGGERIALARPDFFLVTNNNIVTTQANYVVVDETTYTDSGRWARWADGGGSSLELIDPNTDNRFAANWADSDETAKSPWTNIVHTGVLDHNYPVDASGAAIDEIQVMLLGAGEALMDDLVVQMEAGTNRVVNPGFDGGLTGWLIQGNHVRSTLEPAGPGNPSQCMRIRATAGGDNGANRVECNLGSPLTVNSNATIGGRFRWLRGFPIVLLRLHGGALEAVGTLPTPPDLGTPGLPNSRWLNNAGPAIADVSHVPVLPAASQPVLLTARLSDPDGIASVQVRYRVDPSATVNTLAMRDDGTGGDAIAGDGLYTATVPGQAAGATVAFRISATDAGGTPGSTLFPDAAAGEALIRFGEPAIFGNLGVYRIWMTASNLSVWTTRERLSNEALDGTMAYGNFRAIYNAGARYRGSPFTRNPSSPNGVGVAANYVWTLPDDNPLLGSDELNLDCLEPVGSSNQRDATALREATSFEMLNQMNHPFSYQRYVHIVINGVTSASRNLPIYTDSQQPNGEYIAMWFPDDNDGDLFKIDDWFEFNDTPARLGNKSASLENFITTGGVKKQARYRWCWEKKFNRGLNDDYSSLYAAVDALNSPTATYAQQLEREFDLRQWLTELAYRHVVGDWDGYGYNRGKNQFCYRPRNGKFAMLMWDLDFSLGCNGGHGPTQGLFDVSLGGATASDNMPEVNRMYTNGYTRRIYLQALQQMAQGPMLDANFLPPLDARYRALLANGVTAITSPYVASGAQSLSIPAWIQQRRTFMLGNTGGGVGPFTNTPFRITSPLSVTNATNLLTISGTASLQVKDIFLNGVAWPVTWTSVTSWTARVVLDTGSNSFRIEGGGFVGTTNTSNQTVVAHYTGPVATPQGDVVINEIMFNPLVPDAEYIELFNTSSNVTHDLTGWRVNGVDYTFRTAAFIAPRSHLVLFKNLPAFVTAHGPAIPVFDQFEGNLQADGETITLIKPGATAEEDLIIDKVRYEGVLPWPVGTNGIPTSSSIQLIDASKDNSRPLNWFTYFTPAVYGAATNFPGATNGGWRKVTFTGLIAAGANPGTNFLIFLGAPGGDVYIDDMTLVVGTEPEVGPNLLVNGDFEEPLSPAWTVLGNHSNSVVSTSFSHSGTGSLHVIAAAAGGPSSTVRQFIPAPATNNTPHTLTYWFYSTTNSTTLNVRTTSGSLFVNTTNVQVQVIPPFSLPPQVVTQAVVIATPGSNNTSAASLQPIPPLWLNELQADNSIGILDNMGEREPWIELYNAGTNELSLDTYYLANNYDTNLAQWQFPAGATIAPGEFKIIWADGEPGETAGANLHTSFRLNASTGTVALVRVVDAKPEVLDYLTYSGVGTGHSYGDYPDGQPFSRFTMRDVTPRGTNIIRFVNLYINEWLAGNTNAPAAIADPADGQYEDWFEIYNPGTNDVDLGGFFLTDSTSNNTNNYYRVPSNGQYVIPAGGFLLVWADSEPGQNSSDRPDLHVNFALNKAAERIILYGPDGRSLIDRVDFTNQVDNISEGRFPDGALNITTLGRMTPRGPNVLTAGNVPPVIAAIGTKTAILGQPFSFTITATDADPGQTLSYTIVSGAPAGATLHPSSGLFSWNSAFSWTPGTNNVTVQVADNGVPPLTDTETFTLVSLPPAPTLTVSGNQVTIGFQTIPGKTYRVEYKDDLNAAQWQRLNNQDYLAAGASLTVQDNLSGRSQRFYRIVQLD